MFVSRPRHVFCTKALVLTLRSTKPEGSVGDFYGLYKHISFITILVTIILICFIGIFYFLSPYLGILAAGFNFRLYHQ